MLIAKWGGGIFIKSNKNAFTLIELLAIIVILAIIAVITVPIILNIIENSRKGAATDSAYGYKDAVNKAYIQELSKPNNESLKLNGTYTVQSDGTLEPASGYTFGVTGYDSLPVSLSGDKPSSGTLIYDNNVLASGTLIIGDYTATYSNGSFTTVKTGSSSNNNNGGNNEQQSNIVSVDTYYTTYDYYASEDDEEATVIQKSYSSLDALLSDYDTENGMYGSDSEGYIHINTTTNTVTSATTHIYEACRKYCYNNSCNYVCIEPLKWECDFEGDDEYHPCSNGYGATKIEEINDAYGDSDTCYSTGGDLYCMGFNGPISDYEINVYTDNNVSNYCYLDIYNETVSCGKNDY